MTDTEETLRHRKASAVFSEQQDSKSPKSQSHCLVRTTFSKLTNCDHCGRFLWGLIKQGLSCQNCGYACHPECEDVVAKFNCKLAPNNSDILNEKAPSPVYKNSPGKKTSPPQITVVEPTTAFSIDPSQNNALDSLKTIENKPLSRTKSVGPESTRSHKSVLKSMRSMDMSNAQSLPPQKYSSDSLPSPQKKSLEGFMREVIASTEERERKLEKKRNKPALKLMTTTFHNFAQFVPRITELRLFHDALLRIFTWESPLTTWAVFVCYICVCIRPIWLVLLPFISLWVGIIRNSMSGLKVEEPEQGSLHNHNSMADLESTLPAKYRTTILGGEVAAARSIAANYALNVQFIQNLMGTHAQVHDQISGQWKALKVILGPYWALWITTIGLPACLLVYYFVPVRYIFLVCGACSILANHPLIMAFAVTISSFLVDELTFHLKTAKIALKVRGIDSSLVSGGPKPIVVNLFENQRWWAVLGWNDKTFSTERSAWSDESGDSEQVPVFQQELEPGYKWEEDSEWEIVTDWCHPIHPTQEGWVYSNNLWIGPSAHPRIDSFTRRRLWTRTMVPITSDSQGSTSP